MKILILALSLSLGLITACSVQPVTKKGPELQINDDVKIKGFYSRCYGTVLAYDYQKKLYGVVAMCPVGMGLQQMQVYISRDDLELQEDGEGH